MSYTETTEMALRKDNNDEPWINMRRVTNSNLDIIDDTVKSLREVIDNAKALLGAMGLDENGDPLIDAATARATLDAAQDGTAAGQTKTTLEAVRQAAATNATNIASLQDSVNNIYSVNISSYVNSSINIQEARISKFGKVAEIYLSGTATANIATWTSLITQFPSGYQPYETNNAFIINIGNTIHICNMNSNGIVNTPQSISNGAYIRFKAIYIVR